LLKVPQPGVDDVLAFILLMASSEVQLEAITVTFGNTSVSKAHENIVKVAHLLDVHHQRHPQQYPNIRSNDPIILATGAAAPLEGSLDLAEYFHGPDGLSDISRTHPEFNLFSTPTWLRLAKIPAEQVILDILSREPDNTVTILAVGPLTNIARALRKSEGTLSRAKHVVCMGGALDVPGNTSPTAEFNFFADPFAAHEVLEAATRGVFRLTLVPLDITSQFSYPFSKLIPELQAPLRVQVFLSAILNRPRQVLRALGYNADCFEMHDPLAAQLAICIAAQEPASIGTQIWKTRKRRFVIERKGEWTKGMCVIDNRGSSTEAKNTIRTRSEVSALEVDVLFQGEDLDVFENTLLQQVFLIDCAKEST
jgi:inosine-uridine nucleoside N-ribohydrolase